MYKVYSKLEECKAYWDGIGREISLSDDRYEIVREIIAQLDYLINEKARLRFLCLSRMP